MTDRFPSFPWPLLDEGVDQAVARLLQDGSWGHYSGRAIDELQACLRSYFGCEFVALCSSGTIGVEIALHSVHVAPGDEVILAAYDFPGNFRAIEQLGAVPVLVDLAPDSHIMNPSIVDDAITSRTRAVIASHLHGQFAPLEQLVQICRRRGVALVEDACQVPGARWNSRRLGTIGNVGVISFGGSKLLTAGRGGAILSNDESIYQRVRIFCDRGNDAFPLSQLQAAVLPPQLDKLDERNAVRQRSVRSLLDRLRSSTDLIAPSEATADAAYYKLPLIFPGSMEQRTRFLADLSEQGIAIGEGFRGFGLRSARRCRKVGDLANSRLQVARTCLLHHPVFLADDAAIADLADRIAAAFTRSKNGV